LRAEQELLSNRHIEHAAHYTQFLMDRRCFQQALFHESNLCLHQYTFLEPPTQIRFDIVSSQFRKSGAFEHLSQMLQSALVDLVSLRPAERRLGEVLQIRIRPLPKFEILAAAQRGQRVVVSGLEHPPRGLLDSSVGRKPPFRRRPRIRGFRCRQSL
jgi:hypothetical protein